MNIYKTHNVCSRSIEFEVENNIITACKFNGGCAGNTQGVAALAYMDPDQSPDDLEESFKESAARVHTALVTYAARDSDYDGHIIHAGEYLALLDGKLLGSYASLPTLLKELNWAFGELEPEFLTVYYGQDVTETDANGVAESLTSCFPEADVSLVSGGQPVYYYMIAAE